MSQISINNINRPTTPFWNKIQAASMFVNTSILGTAIVNKIEWMLWLAFGCYILAGLIPIFMNGAKPAEG